MAVSIELKVGVLSRSLFSLGVCDFAVPSAPFFFETRYISPLRSLSPPRHWDLVHSFCYARLTGVPGYG